MTLSVRDEGEDYIRFQYQPGRDDDFSVTGSGGGDVSIDFALWKHECVVLVNELARFLAEEIARRERGEDDENYPGRFDDDPFYQPVEGISERMDRLAREDTMTTEDDSSDPTGHRITL